MKKLYKIDKKVLAAILSGNKVKSVKSRSEAIAIVTDEYVKNTKQSVSRAWMANKIPKKDMEKFPVGKKGKKAIELSADVLGGFIDDIHAKTQGDAIAQITQRVIEKIGKKVSSGFVASKLREYGLIEKLPKGKLGRVKGSKNGRQSKAVRNAEHAAKIDETIKNGVQFAERTRRTNEGDDNSTEQNEVEVVVYRSSTSGVVCKTKLTVNLNEVTNSKIRKQLEEECEGAGEGNVYCYNYPHETVNGITVKEDDCSEGLWSKLNELIDYGYGINYKPVSFRLWG
jgi:hypothetical protein